MIIVSKFFVPKGFAAIAIWPFIFIRDKKLVTSTRINHEKIHLRQQIELLVIPFYILYLAHYLWNYTKFRDKRQSYFNIFFEKEAYGNQHNLKYLKHRKPFISFKYLKKSTTTG